MKPRKRSEKQSPVGLEIGEEDQQGRALITCDTAAGEADESEEMHSHKQS